MYFDIFKIRRANKKNIQTKVSKNIRTLLENRSLKLTEEICSIGDLYVYKTNFNEKPLQ